MTIVEVHAWIMSMQYSCDVSQFRTYERNTIQQYIINFNIQLILQNLDGLYGCVSTRWPLNNSEIPYKIIDRVSLPDSKVHGANMGPTGSRWVPCWPHEPCYLGWTSPKGNWDSLHVRCGLLTLDSSTTSSVISQELKQLDNGSEFSRIGIESSNESCMEENKHKN